MNKDYIVNYLRNKINNSWFKNASEDYNIDGYFIGCDFNDHNLTIIWNEMGTKYSKCIPYYTSFDIDDLYAIWCEQCDIKELD